MVSLLFSKICQKCILFDRYFSTLQVSVIWQKSKKLLCLLCVKRPVEIATLSFSYHLLNFSMKFIKNFVKKIRFFGKKSQTSLKVLICYRILRSYWQQPKVKWWPFEYLANFAKMVYFDCVVFLNWRNEVYNFLSF